MVENGVNIGSYAYNAWGAKAFLEFGVSVSDRGASLLARHTAAQLMANSITGYKTQAFFKVFVGLTFSNIVSYYYPFSR